MKKHFNYITLAVGLLLMAGCSKDLDLQPTNDITGDVAYTDPEGYKSGIAKVYGSFSTTGNQGSGSGDLGGIDAGTSDFLRLFWMAQELPTDEAICSWITDDGIPGLNNMTWSSTNIMLLGVYARSIYQITVANEFLRESTSEKLSNRGITGNDATEIAYYAAEARFLRAFQYWVLMDLFANPPFVTETSVVGKDAPPQISRADLFDYVESELLAIEPLLKSDNEYGRATSLTASALLARLYLNAEVYTGTARYNEAASYAEKVIQSGKYSLHTEYANLFMADNNLNNPEVIFSINYDGVNTQNFGGTTYLINAATGGTLSPVDFGVPQGGWQGNRSRPTLPNVFGNHATTNDQRSMFAGSKNSIDNIATFTDGLAVAKFTNKTSTGETAPSVGGTFCSTDFPLFRLAEMYLIYAEASLRGGQGNNATALGYINLLRERAYGNSTGNLSSITLDGILNERMRELYWEGFRRSDLVRYDRFVGSSYLWPWKGGTANGQAVDSFRNIYPLPSTDVIANPNLTQNTGY